MSTTVRVSTQTRDRLAALAAATGNKMSQVIDEAVTEYERQVFWQAFDDGYQRLDDDPAALAALDAERRGEAPSLADGLE